MPTITKITLNFIFFPQYFNDVVLTSITKQKKCINRFLGNLQIAREELCTLTTENLTLL